MKRLAWALPLLFLISCGGKPAGDPRPAVKVLFIGNSYTFANEMPAMLEALAEAAHGRRIEISQETPGGCTLMKHRQDGKAEAAIKQKAWDVVVLQEQSQVPFMAPAMMKQAARELNDIVRKQGAKTLFYATWARKAQPENQAAISESYQECAKQCRAEIAPVDVAWQKVRKSNPKLVLYAADGSHPSPAGSYLVACVFHAKLLGKTPAGLPATVRKGGKTLARLSPSDAKVLQAAAWEAVRATAGSRSGQ